MGSANPGVHHNILRWNMLSRGFQFKDHLPIWSPEPNASLSGGGYLYEYNADGDLRMVHDRFPWSCRKIKSDLYSAALSDAIPILGPNGEFNRELTRLAWSKLLKRDGAADLRDLLRKAGPKVRSLRYWWYEKGGHQYYKTTVGDMIDLALEDAEGKPAISAEAEPQAEPAPEPLSAILTVGFVRKRRLCWWKSAFHTACPVGMVYRKGGKPVVMISPWGWLHVWGDPVLESAPIEINGRTKVSLKRHLRHYRAKLTKEQIATIVWDPAKP